MKDFSKRLSIILSELDLKQNQLADILGVKGGTVSRWVKAKNAPSDFTKTFHILHKLHGVNIEWIEFGKGSPFIGKPGSIITFDKPESYHNRIQKLESEKYKLELEREFCRKILDEFQGRIRKLDQSIRDLDKEMDQEEE